MLLFTFGLAAPALAASTSSSIANSVGAGTGSYPLIGLAYYAGIQSTIQVDYSAFDGLIYRAVGSGDALNFNDKWLYFVFRTPPYTADLAFDFQFDFPCTFDRALIWSATLSSGVYTLQSSYYEFAASEFGYSKDYSDTRVWVHADSTEFPSYTPYRVVALHTLTCDFDIYTNGRVSGLSLRPASDTSAVSVSPRSADLSLSMPSSSISLNQSGSGRWKFGQASYGYAVSSGASASTYALFRYWDGGYVTLANLNRLDSAFSNTSISGIKMTGSFSASTLKASLPGYTGSSANSDYSGSGHFAGSNNVLLAASLNYNYHNDGGIVDNVAHMTDTLDGMAANLQTITDDFTARENVGADIGGTTSQDQISSGAAGVDSGGSALSSGITGLPSFSDVMAPAVGYIGFLTVPIQQIFSFGNGYLLYIATAMVILSVIFFIICKMGGGSGD